MNLEVVPHFHTSLDDKDFKEKVSWYTEINNTYPHLVLDSEL
jgi:hypothetical protein